jgi:type I site-specific restriction-modification system R (restriction) subunit
MVIPLLSELKIDGAKGRTSARSACPTFQAIRARLVKISDRNEKGKSDEEIETAIRQIISEAITADRVIDIFDAAGIKKPDIAILDEHFLQELKDMPQKKSCRRIVETTVESSSNVLANSTVHT